MPANLPRIYYKKEENLRFVQSPEEKIPILKEMLAVMPKHKGTDNLRADLNARIAKLKKEARKKPQIQRMDLYTVAKEGIGQVVLMGPPNSGKSTILSRLTNASPDIAAYPFTTQKPDVGMIEYENVQIQLVDTPPLYGNFHPAWLLALGRSSDILVGVINCANNCEEPLNRLLERFEEGNMFLQSRDFYRGDELMPKPGLVLVTSAREDCLSFLKDKYGERLDIIEFPLDAPPDPIKKKIFNSLGVLRIYTKAPGKEPDFSEPVVLEKGSTVLEAAYEIHKDIAERLKYARLWRDDNKPKQVGATQILQEGDVVEFHNR
ncbi:TGS domain-containing protein [candidate division WOR-3 bacterium]|nr:TGS domain-containing protein [candidate division WOR-3 bacterium]